MSPVRVRFEWLTGLRQPIFRNLRLRGSWDAVGRYSDSWALVPMTPFAAEDGCLAWAAEVAFDEGQRGWTFHWGAVADAPQATNLWAIPTEVADPHSKAQQLSFRLGEDGQVERYYLTDCRRFGANKRFRPGEEKASLHFSVWAPNAREVAVITGDLGSGYIWSSGAGTKKEIPLQQIDGNGIWTSQDIPDLSDFSAWDHTPYMFRIMRDDGSIALRSDIYSRCQLGSGTKDPEKPDPKRGDWDGTRQDLKSTKSCSVVIDPERVTKLLEEGRFPETEWLDEKDFWADEYDPLRPVPDRLEELVIYEMHVEGLFTGTDDPGRFQHAIAFLDHLVELGVNAVELLPIGEAEPDTWRYGTSHHFATDYAGGGRDQFKHFVRACHQRGIAVLLDVVYNHYVADAERAEWLFDSPAHEKSLYYWYEGRPGDWTKPCGGYLDNGSSGWLPNLRSEIVRRMFTSAAAALVAEFHVDGFRVDLTQALHRDNVLHANGRPVPEANLYGQKFLREWVATLRLIKPSIILTAEDHTGWRAITQPQRTGGIGFDAAWWAEYYHQLVGDSQNTTDNARLIWVSGFGGSEPLAMSRFAGILAATPTRVIYHESHDQAGNASYRIGNTDISSARTIEVAVNGQLSEGSRAWAEARCRVAAGITLLTPAAPMFFMGEEVGAREPYRYTDWIHHREDLAGLRAGTGAGLFAFYRDLIQLRRRSEAMLSPNIGIVHAHDANRVIAFRRWLGEDDFLIVASLGNTPFADGYWLGSADIRDGAWIEVLNSDAQPYGGAGLCNPDTRWAANGGIDLRLPANGLAVLQRI